MTIPSKKFTIFCLGSDFTFIGPRRISAYLRDKGVQTRLIFVPSQSPFEFSLNDNCKKQLTDFLEQDCAIGFSFTSNYLKIAELLTFHVKEKLSVPIIWGGVHASVAPEESLKVCDFVCLGEGEDALWELLNNDYNNNAEEKYQIKNFWFKSGNKILKNNQRPLKTNLDELPFQDYEIENHFILDGNNLRQLQPKDLKRNYVFALRRMLTFGCPFRCSYCINDRLQLLDSRYAQLRRYSVDYFINETKYILRKLPFVVFLKIEDDAFLALPQKIIEEFSWKYKKEINLPYSIGGVKAELVKKEKLEPLVNSGMITVRMGIQSASERINKDIYHRRFSKEKTLEAVKIINLFKNRLSPPPSYDIMFDNPWEGVEDKLETLSFFNSLPRPYSFNVFSLTFFPGTELYQRALEEKLISGFDSLRHYHKLKRNFLNLFLLSLSLIRCPEWLYRRIISSQLIKNGSKEYRYIYFTYLLVKRFLRKKSFYTNRLFISAIIRRRLLRRQ